MAICVNQEKKKEIKRNRYKKKTGKKDVDICFVFSNKLQLQDNES